MQIVNDFTKNEKLSAIAMLTIISAGSDNRQNKRLKEKTISQHMKFLNLTNNEFDLFIKSNPSSESISKILKPLDSRKKELLIALGYELLICTGSPSEREYNVTIHILKEIAGIEENTFVESVEKLNSIQNFLSKR